MTPTTRIVANLGLAAAFLGIAGLSYVAMRGAGAQAEAEDAPLAPVAVEVVTVRPSSHRAVVTAKGTVQASARVDVVAQVSGKVVELAKGLTPGLRLRAGETLARIDPRDYESAVVQAEASVRQAEVELALEEGRVRQAAREWELLGQAAEAPLARREPQLAAAQARLAGAQAQLANARLALERTRLVAPWPAVVLSESLDVGQVVAPGAPVATLMGTERFRVRVSVPVHQMRLLELPAEGEAGPRAVVRQRLPDGTSLEREGFLLRTLGELDAETRTAGVLVALDDPFEVPEGTLPILPGAYVEVAIDGQVADAVVKVPRAAVTGGDGVWVAEAGDRLARRELVVGWGDADAVYALSGLADGDRVVVSPLALPVPGMPLDVREAVAADAEEAP